MLKQSDPEGETEDDAEISIGKGPQIDQQRCPQLTNDESGCGEQARTKQPGNKV